MIAWAATTWSWYWETFSWAGVAIAFLVALLTLSFCFFLVALAVRWWRDHQVSIPHNEDLEPANFSRSNAPTVSVSHPTLQG